MTAEVDVAVIVVTYNSARDIDALLDGLVADSPEVTRRIVVADNSSTDGTAEIVASHHDVELVETGGNLGYSAGINAARQAAGPAQALFIVNPDSIVHPGLIRTLRERLFADDAIGAVVPRIVDSQGVTTRSLRREPTLVRAVGDALFGRRWRSRPAAFAEQVVDDSSYRIEHPIDWATGAAIMIRADAAARIGPWDETFFLFSEETDYCRRLRSDGHEIRYVPEAVITHHQGGSGASQELVALTLVNKVRYARKHHGPLAAASMRAVLIASELLRHRDATHALARRMLRDPSRWPTLDPRADSQPGRGAEVVGR